MNIFCLGLSHQTAHVSVRERFAVPDAILAEALQRLRKVPGVDEAVILSTCNRTEFYLAGFAGRPTPETVFGGLQRRLHKGDLEHLFQLSAAETVRHLFRVTSGLESMVVGETEIFGQRRPRWAPPPNTSIACFRGPSRWARRCRTNTGIAKGSVSVGSVAVDLAMQIFGSLQGCKVILLGGRRNQRAHGPSLSVAGSATDFRVEPVL